MLAERENAENPTVRVTGDGLEEISKRGKQAADWTDTQIRKLIAVVQKHGKKNAGGKFEIDFRSLFKATEDIFDALAGLLRTAKKYEVIGFTADMLLQGQNDRDVITLLKEKHDGVKLFRRKSSSLVATPAKGGFGQRSLKDQNLPCHVCSKTVYPMEFVGASEKAFHKRCFRCTKCNGQLTMNDYAVGPDGNFYCNTHNREVTLEFMKNGVAGAAEADLAAEEAEAEAAEAFLVAELVAKTLRLDQASAAVYEALWSEAGGDLGRVGQSEALAFFATASLDDATLEKIWEMCDKVEPHGVLSKREFFTALKLVALAQWGVSELDLDILGAEAATPNIGSHVTPGSVPDAASQQIRGADYDSDDDEDGVDGEEALPQLPPDNNA